RRLCRRDLVVADRRTPSCRQYAGENLSVLFHVPDREIVMGVVRRRGVVPVARLFDGGLAGLERDLGPLRTPRDRRIANPRVVGGGRMGVGERDVPILIDGKAGEISVLTGAPGVDD